MKPTKRPEPCTCANGPCEGDGTTGCKYNKAAWDAWEAAYVQPQQPPLTGWAATLARGIR